MGDQQGKITCFGLGEKGVNLVKSPLHLDDGELTNAQNAEFFRNQGRGGIRKRGGLARFNASALGVIRRFMNVPLPATPTVTLLAGVEGTNVETWVTSTNGTAWAEAQAPPRPFRSARRTGLNFQQLATGRIASIDGRIYYPGDDYVKYPTASHQPPPIMVYDGQDSGEVCQVPNNPQVGAAANAQNVEYMATLNGTIYLTTYDGASGGARDCGRVFELDPSSGTLTQIGKAFGDGTGDIDPGVGLRPYSLGWGAGRLWVGMLNDSGSTAAASIYSILPGVDENWTLEFTFGVNEVGVLSLCEYQGLMYAGIIAGGAVVARVYVRQNNLGGWTSSDSQVAGTATYKYYTGLYVFAGNLYAGYGHFLDASELIRKYDGAAWSTDLTVSTLIAGATMLEGMAIRTAMYFVINTGGSSAGVLRKATGGAWAIVADFATVIGSSRGLIGFTIK